MGILDRSSDIIRANINNMLDESEDPAKMIDQFMRDLSASLSEVRKEISGIIAEETRTGRLLNENLAGIERCNDLARAALEAGNESDARSFLMRRQQLEVKAVGLRSTYEVAHENAQRMRYMHDKLVNDLEVLNIRREAVKAKVAVAKTQDRVNEIASGMGRTSGSFSAFDRMESHANQMLDQANAMNVLNQQSVDKTTMLEEKYSNAARNATVDEEIAKLKAEIRR